MSNFEAFCLVVFVSGILLFPLILISGFFFGFSTVSVVLCVDALLVSLANFPLQRRYDDRSK